MKKGTVSHTPGPWGIRETSVSKTGYPAIYTVIGSEKNKALPFAMERCANDICIVDGKENAYLIAAAPELLEALKQIHYGEDQYQHNYGLCNVCPLIEKAERG